MERQRRLRDEILDLVYLRGEGKTICPSEVARRVGDGENWRDLMGPVKVEARRLVAEGVVVIKQKGEVVDPDEFTGPYRIGLAKSEREQAD